MERGGRSVREKEALCSCFLGRDPTLASASALSGPAGRARPVSRSSPLARQEGEAERRGAWRWAGSDKHLGQGRAGPGRNPR